MISTKSKIKFLKELLFLKEVMDAGCIQAAAIRNGIKQTNLSKTITDLENYLDIKLLHRGPTGVTPTNSARLLYADIEDICKKVNKVCDSFLDKNDLDGTITLWAEEGFIGSPLLKDLSELYAQYPKIRLDILTSSHVNLSKVDIVVKYHNEHTFLNGKELFRTQIQTHLYSTQAYLDKHGVPKNMDDLLENYDLCMRQIYLNWPECQVIAKRAKHLNTTADLGSVVLRLVIGGGGISLLPDWSTRISPDLIRLDHIPFSTTRTFTGVCRAGLESSPKIQVLGSFLQKILSKNT